VVDPVAAPARAVNASAGLTGLVKFAVGDVAVAVFGPVPVTESVPTHGVAGVVNVAAHDPWAVEKPLTVADPLQPPPYVAPVNPVGIVPP
jgi:hypothetical protein